MTVRAPSTATGFFDNAYLLLTLTPLFWAGNFVLGRAVAGHIPPIGLAWLRWTFAALIMAYFAWPHLKRDWPQIRAHWPILLLLGLLGPTLFNTMTYIGLNHTTALNGLLMQSSAPVLIVLAAFLTFGDRITLMQLLGILVSLAGVVTIIGEGDVAVLSALSLNVGDLIILAAFVSWGFYTAFLRKRPDIHWLSFAVVIAGVAAVANFPMFLWESAQGQTLKPTLMTVLAVAYVAIFPSILSYNFYNRGVQLIGPARAGVFMHLVPLFGTGLAILLLGEEPRWYHGLGFALILAGVFITARKQ